MSYHRDNPELADTKIQIDKNIPTVFI